jgi:hypothetical protein
MWIGLRGGGLGAIGNKIKEDIKKTMNVGKQLYDWTTNGLSRFYEGMPKIDLEESLINSMNAVPGIPFVKDKIIDAVKNWVIPEFKKLVGFEGKFEIPDIGWMLNPFNVIEKFDVFRRAFFDDKPMNDGELKKTDEETDSSSKPDPTKGPQRSDYPNTKSGQKQFEEARSEYESGGGSSADFSGGGDAASKFYNQLISDGVSPAAAAGIVGNIEAESAFDPAAIEAGNGIGRGLIQWSYGRRTAFEKWSKKNNLDPDSMEANYGYLLYEMKGGDGNHWIPRKDTPSELVVRSYEEFLEKSKDPETAAKLFMYNYERPLKAVQHLDRRINAAKGISKSAAESSTGDQSTSQSTSSGDAYASGLKTGPSERIGGSSGYHVDTKFKAGMSMEQKIQMMDQLSQGYAQQGRVIEFSNTAVQNKVYNHTMTYEEKASLLKKAFGAHNLPRGRAIDQGGFNSIDYYIPLAKDSKDTGGKGRFRKSAEQAEVLVPTIDGGTLEYHKGGSYGSFVVGVDKDGNVLYKTGHGDTRTSSDRGTVKFGKPKPKPKPTPRQSEQLTIPTSEIPKEGAPQAEWDAYFKKVDGLSTKPSPTPTAPTIKPRKKSRYSQRPQEVSSYPSYESSGTDMIALLTPIPSEGSGSSGQISVPGGGSISSSPSESAETSSHMSNKYFGKSVTAQLYKFG